MEGEVKSVVTPILGRDYLLQADKEWPLLNPTPGLVLEFSLSDSSAGILLETWGALLVVERVAGSDGGLILRGPLLGIENCPERLEIMERYDFEKRGVHLCLQSPCVVVAEEEESCLHCVKVRFWEVESFDKGYLTAEGKKILKDLEPKDGGAAPKRTSRRPGGREKPEAAAKRAPKEKLSRNAGRVPKEKKRPRKDKEEGSEDVVDIDAEERAMLRDRLSKVRKRLESGTGKGEDRSGGPKARDSGYVQEENRLTSGARLHPGKSVLLALGNGEEDSRGVGTKKSKKKRDRRKRKDTGSLLLAQAEQQRGRTRGKRRSGDKKEKKLRKALSVLVGRRGGKKRSKKRKKKKERRREDPGGSGSPGSSSSDSSSYEEEDEDSSGDVSSSGDGSLESELSMEAPLRKRSLEKPGSVMAQLVRQAASQLDRGAVLDGGDGEDAVVGGVRIATYFSLLIRPYHPPTHPMIRELYSLAQVIDSLRSGLLAQAADGLAGRFIAVHQALEDGNWQAASALEIYPLEQASSATTATLLRAQRHRRLLEKSQGWQRYGRGKGKGSWNNQEKGGKGKTKDKGKKGKGKGGDWSAWQKDNPWKESKEDKQKKPDG